MAIQKGYEAIHACSIFLGQLERKKKPEHIFQVNQPTTFPRAREKLSLIAAVPTPDVTFSNNLWW